MFVVIGVLVSSPFRPGESPSTTSPTARAVSAVLARVARIRNFPIDSTCASLFKPSTALQFQTLTLNDSANVKLVCSFHRFSAEAGTTLRSISAFKSCRRRKTRRPSFTNGIRRVKIHARTVLTRMCRSPALSSTLSNSLSTAVSLSFSARYH
jgi:hypothetical protein